MPLSNFYCNNYKTWKIYHAIGLDRIKWIERILQETINVSLKIMDINEDNVQHCDDI